MFGKLYAIYDIVDIFVSNAGKHCGNGCYAYAIGKGNPPWTIPVMLPENVFRLVGGYPVIGGSCYNIGYIHKFNCYKGDTNDDKKIIYI